MKEIIDGEGCIRLSKTKTRGMFIFEVDVSQTTKAPLERLQQFYGGSLNERQKPMKSGARLNRWVLQGQNAYKMLTDIEPYIVVKRPHIQEGRRPSCRDKHPTPLPLIPPLL